LRGEDVSRSLKLLCLKRNIENLSTIQEKSGYLLGQRGNERFVAFASIWFRGKRLGLFGQVAFSALISHLRKP
jgi:hypothetical protein